MQKKFLRTLVVTIGFLGTQFLPSVGVAGLEQDLETMSNTLISHPVGRNRCDAAVDKHTTHKPALQEWLVNSADHPNLACHACSADFNAWVNSAMRTLTSDTLTTYLATHTQTVIDAM